MAAEPLMYYRAALALLRHVEARQPTSRRFGKEADALWSQFKGELTPADRMDLLLRDADAQWPGAFGVRSVFDRAGVSEDETFGADWSGLDGVLAAEIWRAADDVDCGKPLDALRAIASSWGFSLVDCAAPVVGAADQIVVAGPSAVAALVGQFVGQEALAWADQVTVVATPPGHRQLALSGGAILGATQPVRVVSVESPAIEGAREQLKGKTVKLLVSPDAAPEDAAQAQALAGGR